ncbi:hypothetical protein BOTCAL_0240g00030 [Botryotinia calthae]|uniref:DUF7918 domain-containing protein n=1 Tax=Botryotinia calthae TaxID=38488 RepID=A0A4Y8CXY0_9HELO|nr:hypothetical protein BOTCAL_0240g00030 [Botryotinia calthae]
MAIMAGMEGEIEVRIKRHSGKYYDEYVKLKPSEGSSKSQNERYIMVEHKDTYYVEVTLKEGFDFGKCHLVQAKMCVDGKEVSYADFKPPSNGLDKTKTNRDLVEKFQYANVEINGRPRGSRFVFWNMEIEKDAEQSEETGTVDTLSQNIPAFQFHIVFFESSTVTLSDYEYKEEIVSWENECAKLRSKSRNLTLPKKPDRTKKGWRCDRCIEGVELFPRSTEFFEDDNIAKFAQSVHLYDWNALKKEERKIAVEQLQELEKAHWDTINGNEVGQNFGFKVNRRRPNLTKNLPREWRAWHKMYGTEQRETFDILQERQRARERGGRHFQYISMGGDIMLSEDESGESVTALPIATIPNTAPLDQLPTGKEAPAPANSPYGENRLRAVGSSPDGMGADAVESYSPTYPRMERMATAALLNPRLSLAKESSVGITDESLTQSTFPDITTAHRKKTVIPGVEVKLESIRDSLINQIDGLNSQVAASQVSTTRIKREPIEVVSLDSDDEIMFVSETRVFKAVRHSEPVRATKAVIANVDENLQELKELQKLREEKENLQRDIELLEKKRKMDEITKKIEDAEAKAKRIKTE